MVEPSPDHVTLCWMQLEFYATIPGDLPLLRTCHRHTGQNSPRGGGSAESKRTTDRKGQAGSHLVDEVANVREDAFTQFHAHQTRTE